ncbi:hypothetical protein ACFO9Q_10190 [Paenibacillus sp. GCM10023252]|uniref:hypothetical protein n=1 Tax=Paenibacillus sp. GCM10023252 TaxID=3252649 RepID=UPI00360E5B81
MKLKDLINDLLPMISNRIMKETNNKLADYGSRGVGKSSFAFFDSISIGFNVLNEEINELFNKLSRVSINPNDIVELRIILLKFVEDQYSLITEKSTSLIGTDLIKNFNSNDFIEQRKKESVALFEFQINVRKKLINDKKKTTRWEVMKLIISSVLGAGITLIVRAFIDS